jgi:hypothetical protein
MDNYYRNRIDALLTSTLATQRLDIRDAFRKRHSSLIDKQSYLVLLKLKYVSIVHGYI